VVITHFDWQNVGQGCMFQWAICLQFGVWRTEIKFVTTKQSPYDWETSSLRAQRNSCCWCNAFEAQLRAAEKERGWQVDSVLVLLKELRDAVGPVEGLAEKSV